MSGSRSDEVDEGRIAGSASCSVVPITPRLVCSLILFQGALHLPCSDRTQPSRKEQYLTHLEQEEFSLYYRARVKSIISNFAEFLIKENKLFQGNPTRGIKLLPEQPQDPADGSQGSSSH